MIGWHSDNQLSYTVMKAIPGIRHEHLSSFDATIPQEGVFYGILRGASRAMHILKYLDIPFWYIDNGYFEAQYVDKNMCKDMSGKFRIVKNDMHEIYAGKKQYVNYKPRSAVVLPPSVYSAIHYDTLPEEWKKQIGVWLEMNNIKYRFREKNSVIPLEEDLNNAEAVVSFNSMAIMEAIRLGKPVMDTHGILKRKDFVTINYDDVRTFYDSKQFTLKQISGGAVTWN